MNIYTYIFYFLEENNTIFQQTESYDPNTGEIEIQVFIKPGAHMLGLLYYNSSNQLIGLHHRLATTLPNTHTFNFDYCLNTIPL